MQSENELLSLSMDTFSHWNAPAYINNSLSLSPFDLNVIKIGRNSFLDLV